MFFVGDGEFDVALASGDNGRRVEHSVMAEGFEILVERSGIEFLRVEFLGKLESGIESDEAVVELNGARRLESGVGFFLEFLQFGQIGTKRERLRLRNGGERGGEFCETGFALGLAEVEEAVGRLGGERETASAIEQRDGTAESRFGECTDCGGRASPIFFAAGAIDGGQIFADVFPFDFKGGVAGFYGVGFFESDARALQKILSLK